MVSIRPLRAEDIPGVKRIIYKVAYGIFGWEGSLENLIEHLEATGELKDVDEAQTHYFENRGMFLVALDGDTLVGSGALRKLDPQTAELKRMWLLEDYHGRGIGYTLINKLTDFAEAQGYERIVLQTSRKQTRALSFYNRLGFKEIASYNEDPSEVSMEIQVRGTKTN